MKLTKTLAVALLVFTVVALVVSTGLVSAIGTNDISVNTILSAMSAPQGGTTYARIELNNNLNEDLRILSVGIHFDWMNPNDIVGLNMNANPIVISANTKNYPLAVTSPIKINIPTNVTAGNYQYYVEIVGNEASTGNSFTWDSPKSTMQIYNEGGGPTAFPSTTPTSGSGAQGGLDWLPIIAVVMVLAIVAVVLLLFAEMRKKTKKVVPAGAEGPEPQAEQPTPAEQPKPVEEQKPASDKPLENIESDGT